MQIKLFVTFLAAASCALPQVANRAPLQPNAFNPLPLGAIEPRGWLRAQLQLQADGLTGHLDEFWNDVGSNSGWLGGTGESWERGPYYLDGLLPLAYQLKNPKLIAKAQRWVEWTLNSQRSDGQFGPPTNDDWWPRMVMLKVLTQYQEVTADPRVIPLMTRYFAFERTELPQRPLRDWGKYRWQDNVYTVLWLYNRTGDKSLLDLAQLLHKQGYDWQAQFTNFQYKTKVNGDMLGLGKPGAPPDRAMQSHGVNNAMALKASPLWWLVTGNASDKEAFSQQVSMLDTYHGLPNGMFSGDEHFAGKDPSQGIELCAVVEAMFSYEQAFAILGSPSLADRLEKVAYNALPATLSDDLWSHQYDQQPNQIACTRAHRQWSTNGNDSNLFGLEANFGCCTANLHQGWPKFVSSLWMATREGGLAVVAYAPSQVHTRIGDSDVIIDEDTEYPFRHTVRFLIHTSSPRAFALHLHKPGWASAMDIKANGETSSLPGLTRTWKDGDTVEIEFQSVPRITRWFHNSAVFEHGPLVFALPLDAQWKQLQSYAEKSADWQLESHDHWNYGVSKCEVSVQTHTLATVPFDVQHPAVTLGVRGRLLPEWTASENSAGPLPASPVHSQQPEQVLTLVPYGSAKLRVTAFPSLDEPSACHSR